jgi:catechol 2,3-dioxygenase-like lactoylglutathione lyase family enzyme
VTLPARVSFVTLAVRDLPRMAAFFRQFGWPESETNDENHVAFQCGGAVLGLYGAEHYEPEFGPAPGPGDPEGNVWDVIRTAGTSFDERGGLIFP